MSYQVPFAATNTNMPDNRPFMTQIAEMDTLIHSWNAVPAGISMGTSPLVLSVNDLEGSINWTGPSGKQATLEEDAILDQWPALTFAGDQVYVASGQPAFASAFTLVSLTKGTAGRVISKNDATLEQTTIKYNSATQMHFLHGNGNILATVPEDEWHLMIAASDGSTLYLSVNGGPTQTTATNNDVAESGAVLGAANAAGGEYFSGSLSRIHMHSGVLFTTAAGRAKIETYKQMARRVYGASIV
jgi:hypothetical protein